jgi:hypothetical protein
MAISVCNDAMRVYTQLLKMTTTLEQKKEKDIR